VQGSQQQATATKAAAACLVCGTAKEDCEAKKLCAAIDRHQAQAATKAAGELRQRAPEILQPKPSDTCPSCGRRVLDLWGELPVALRVALRVGGRWVCSTCYESGRILPDGTAALLCEVPGCSRPATCLGAYEGAERPTRSCDAHCGHGQEDGRCVPLDAGTDALKTLEQALAADLCGACEQQLEDDRSAVCHTCAPEALALPMAMAMAEGLKPEHGGQQEATGAPSPADIALAVPSDTAPCCEDAGQDRCHGQPRGACGCYACRRYDRRRVLNHVRRLEGVLLDVAPEDKMHRRALADVLRTLRNARHAAWAAAKFWRDQAHDMLLEHARAMRHVEGRRASMERRHARVVHLAWGYRFHARRLKAAVAEEESKFDEALERGRAERARADEAEAEALRRAQEVNRLVKERDDATMEASAAAEMHHAAMRDLEAAQAEAESARLEVHAVRRTVLERIQEVLRGNDIALRRGMLLLRSELERAVSTDGEEGRS
jgi:hypothetical protein